MAMKVHARSAGFRGYPVEAGSAELDARDFEVELEEGTETLELLPPAELEEVELTTGGLPFEVWRRLAGFLDASALSEAMSVATMFTLPTAAEAELWANLVQLDFPKMYSSIIAECAGGSMEKQTSSRKSSKNSAKEGRRRPAGTGHARGGRLWRGVQLETHDGRDENHPADPVGDMQVWPYCTCSDDVICEVCSSLLATSTATPGSSPLGSPWLQNHRSPLPSPALSFQLEPSPEVKNLRRKFEAAGLDAEFPTGVHKIMACAYGTYFEIIFCSLYLDKKLEKSEKKPHFNQAFRTLEATVKQWGSINPYIHSQIRNECARLAL